MQNSEIFGPMFTSLFELSTIREAVALVFLYVISMESFCSVIILFYYATHGCYLFIEWKE